MQEIGWKLDLFELREGKKIKNKKEKHTHTHTQDLVIIMEKEVEMKRTKEEVVDSVCEYFGSEICVGFRHDDRLVSMYSKSEHKYFPSSFVFKI